MRSSECRDEKRTERMADYGVKRIESCSSECRDEKRTESVCVRAFQLSILVAVSAAMKSGLKGNTPRTQ